MVVGKVSSGLLRPVCGTRQILSVVDDPFDLVADLIDGPVVALVADVARW